MFTNTISRLPRIPAFLVPALLLAGSARANGIYRNGTGAASMGLAGADVAWSRDPLSAMSGNPAGLATTQGTQVSLGITGGSADGTITRTGSGGDLYSRVLAAPELAIALPSTDGRTVFGFSSSVDSGLSADWTYVDPPGGLGGSTSYGLQRNRARIAVVRSALGAAFRATDSLSLGANLGVLYNDNALQAPYVFQSNPALARAKTLLDLKADGFGWNVQLGALYQARSNLHFGLSYRNEASVHATGQATGAVGVQLGAATVPFRYDAEVTTTFPHQVAAGVSWSPAERWRLAAQVEWIGWGSAFEILPVRLSNGSNPAINGLVGGTSLADDIPLEWRDSWVFRVGAEYHLSEAWILRAGYAHGQSPVPSSTLTPMTAALMEHTVATGAGYSLGRWSFDAAYQFDLPASRSIGISALRSGEYSNSSIEVLVHTVSLTARYRF
jgi:long-chain fatty acid transport protein